MRKRSKYRPRPVAPAAWVQAVNMQHNMADDQLLDLGMAIHTSIERHRRTGQWGFSGPEMQAINDCAHLHEQQIALVPRRECRDAMIEVRRRAARGDVLNRVPA